MSLKINSNINSRVKREKAAHNEDDVLRNSYKLKSIFNHTKVSHTMMRFEKEFTSYIKDVKGIRVLDLGCGHGDLSLLLLEKGAEFVAGIDICENYIDDAAERARGRGINDQRFSFSVMDAHALKFKEGAFDLVIGSGILHHLDLEASLNEINRVLSPGGRALFKEPLAAHPLLKIFRVLTPKSRTIDEKPLTKNDLLMIQKNWDVRSSYYGIISAPIAMLTSVILRPFPNNYLLKISELIEKKLINVKYFQPYNQYVLLNLVKK